MSMVESIALESEIGASGVSAQPMGNGDIMLTASAGHQIYMTRMMIEKIKQLSDNIHQSEEMSYTFVDIIKCEDPDDKSGYVDVEMEVWKDNHSGGIFAVDSSFLDQVDHFYNPFNGKCEITNDVLPVDERL